MSGKGTRTMNAQTIDDYEAGGTKLEQAIRGLTGEDLLASPPSEPEIGKWTIQQVVLHLCDSDLVYAERMKRVIAEENPTLHYAEQSAEDAVTLLATVRRQMARILRKLPESAFARSGNHTEYGKRTLAHLVEGAVKHLDHHIAFIHKKRAAMGKEMW
jgi:uncharacterized damage-inducible protein DinB